MLQPFLHVTIRSNLKQLDLSALFEHAMIFYASNIHLFMLTLREILSVKMKCFLGGISLCNRLNNLLLLSIV